jgi:hypothetical protein
LTSEEKPPGVSVIEDAYRRWADMPPVELKIHRQDAFTVLMALQAAIRMPGMAPVMADNMTSVGRQIQEFIVDDPELYAIAETGWNPELDVEQEDGSR